MMYEMRKKKPDPTLLLTQGIFIGMVSEELAFDWLYVITAGKWNCLNVMALTGFVLLLPGPPTQCLNQLSYLATPTELARCLH